MIAITLISLFLLLFSIELFLTSELAKEKMFFIRRGVLLSSLFVISIWPELLNQNFARDEFFLVLLILFLKGRGNGYLNERVLLFLNILLLLISLFIDIPKYNLFCLSLIIYITHITYSNAENSLNRIGAFLLINTIWIFHFLNFSMNLLNTQILLGLIVFPMFTIYKELEEKTLLTDSLFYNVLYIFYFFKIMPQFQSFLSDWPIHLIIAMSLLISFRELILSKERIRRSKFLLRLILTSSAFLIARKMDIEILISGLSIISLLSLLENYKEFERKKTYNYMGILVLFSFFLITLPYSPMSSVFLSPLNNLFYSKKIILVFINSLLGAMFLTSFLKIDFSERIFFRKSYTSILPLFYSMIIIISYISNSSKNLSRFVFDEYLITILSFILGAALGYFVKTKEVSKIFSKEFKYYFLWFKFFSIRVIFESLLVISGSILKRVMLFMKGLFILEIVDWYGKEIISIFDESVDSFYEEKRSLRILKTSLILLFVFLLLVIYKVKRY